MGDAGPPSIDETQHVSPPLPDPAQSRPRDIHILVTGFGPFKSFTNNPSYLIASALAETLSPAPPPPPKDTTEPPSTQPGRNSITSFLNRHLTTQSQSQTQPQQQAQPLHPPSTSAYNIHVHTYPTPFQVAYVQTSVVIPSLLNPSTNASTFPDHPAGIDFDYVLHIGLASGRDSYTLETIAHRDDYIITDVVDEVGAQQSDIWGREGVPESLEVGWDSTDVLWRWTSEVQRRENEAFTLLESTKEVTPTTPTTNVPSSSGLGIETGSGMKSWMLQHGMLLRPQQAPSSSSGATQNVVGGGSVRRNPRRAVVKLSRDAGRYLCEFILMCSLVYRWKEEVRRQARGQAQSPSKLGKVAFLHVPNGTEPSDIQRGVIVAESAIRSVIASWEAGWRNPNVYAAVPGVSVGVGDEGPEVGEPGYEDKTTGDEVLGRVETVKGG